MGENHPNAPALDPLPPDAGASPIRVRHLVAIFVWAVALGLFVYFFGAAKLVLLSLLAAGCLMAALRPVAEHIPGPRTLKGVVAGLIPPLIIVGVVSLASWLMADQIRKELGQWPQIRANINQFLARHTGWMGTEQPLDVQSVLQSVGGFLTGGEGTQLVQTTASATAGFLVAVFVVIFGTIYLLLEPRGRLLNPILRMLPPGRRRQTHDAFTCLEPRLRWWTIGVAISISVVGLATWIGFSIVGLQLAAPLALLAAMAEIVPNIGPFIAFMIALLFGAAQGKTVGVLIVWICVQLLESYVLLPFVMKKAVKIPPFVTLISVIFWGKLFGLPGVLLAIPLNLLIWSFAEQFLLRRYDSTTSAAKGEQVHGDTLSHDHTSHGIYDSST